MLSVTYAECHLCRVSIMLSVNYAQLHLQAHFALSVVMLNIIMLNIIMTVSGAPISRVAKSSLKQKTKFCLQILPHETKGTMNKMRLKQNEIGKILFLAQA